MVLRAGFLDCSKISVISVYDKIFEKHCGAMAMSLHLFCQQETLIRQAAKGVGLS